METSLRDKYCIVGVGETEYSRGSGRTTRALGAEAIRNAMHDAGLAQDQVDGMLSYHGGDSTPSTSIRSSFAKWAPIEVVIPTPKWPQS